MKNNATHTTWQRTRPTIRGTSIELESAARQMRWNMTPAEKLLWENLRSKKLGGFKFRAQHALGNIVLDFYCPSARLGVEVDGGVHNGREELDAARAQHLNSYGIQVIRFSNDEVLSNISGVLERIQQSAQEAQR